MESLTIKILNLLGKERVPFIFIVDFDKKTPWICPLSEVDKKKVLFDVNGVANFENPLSVKKKLEFKLEELDKSRYQKAFDFVEGHITHGNSFLLNLTLPSKIETNFTLKEIFYHSNAKYKLWFKDQFVVFSPETFIKINGQKISAFPMKGTINASLPDAKNKLLTSKKELAEHYTIVDLIRNDLSMVAKKVIVERFQYIDHIKTHRHELFQMSSEISGELPKNYHDKLGEIIFKMLPAGSITGAPKSKTIEVIKEAEKYDRGFYTGVFGIFDGENVDSGVMIRFIEKTAAGMIYKSGGGITAKSNCEEEYQELIDKIYIPV